MIGFFSNKDSLKAKLFRKSNLSTALVNLDHTSNTLPPPGALYLTIFY